MEIVRDYRFNTVALIMTSKTMGAITWKLLVNINFIPFTSFDLTIFVVLRFHPEFQLGISLCPIQANVEKGVSDYRQSSPPHLNIIGYYVSRAAGKAPTLLPPRGLFITTFVVMSPSLVAMSATITICSSL